MRVSTSSPLPTTEESPSSRNCIHNLKMSRTETTVGEPHLLVTSDDGVSPHHTKHEDPNCEGSSPLPVSLDQPHLSDYSKVTAPTARLSINAKDCHRLEPQRPSFLPYWEIQTRQLERDHVLEEDRAEIPPGFPYIGWRGFVTFALEYVEEMQRLLMGFMEGRGKYGDCRHTT